jgi:hypothetical protein
VETEVSTQRLAAAVATAEAEGEVIAAAVVSLEWQIAVAIALEAVEPAQLAVVAATVGRIRVAELIQARLVLVELGNEASARSAHVDRSAEAHSAERVSVRTENCTIEDCSARPTEPVSQVGSRAVECH